jgi:hypothetical protein
VPVPCQHSWAHPCSFLLSVSQVAPVQEFNGARIKSVSVGHSTSDSSTSVPWNGAKCASEGQACSCSGPVYYGADIRWRVKDAAGSISCTNTVFGDPAPSVGKACWCVVGGSRQLGEAFTVALTASVYDCAPTQLPLLSVDTSQLRAAASPNGTTGAVRATVARTQRHSEPITGSFVLSAASFPPVLINQSR